MICDTAQQYAHSAAKQCLMALSVVILLFSSHSQAALEDTFTITPFSTVDSTYLSRQRAYADELAYQHLYLRFGKSKEEKLALLQRLIDTRKIRPDQQRELQALGTVLGEVLADEYRLSWVVYRDDVGRSRGLQVGDTRQVIFPLTMISRRIEADARADVKAIYAKAEGIVKHTLDNRLLMKYQ